LDAGSNCFVPAEARAFGDQTETKLSSPPEKAAGFVPFLRLVQIEGIEPALFFAILNGSTAFIRDGDWKLVGRVVAPAQEVDLTIGSSTISGGTGPK
jgi:hypothetical protein